MHLFLYQSARHLKPNYGGRRLSQTSYNNDFDLELLRTGIKGRFEIIGHGIHPFQKAMKQLGMEEEFYGHIIQIEDSKNAVWFKLNYDNIGKHVTKYQGGWRDLDAESIAPQVHQYQLLEQITRNLYAQIASTNSQKSYVQGYAGKVGHPFADEARNKGHEYIKVLEVAAEKLTEERDFQLRKMKDLQEQVRIYMKEHKG